jgi:hypothetical protein
VAEYQHPEVGGYNGEILDAKELDGTTHDFERLNAPVLLIVKIVSVSFGGILSRGHEGSVALKEQCGMPKALVCRLPEVLAKELPVVVGWNGQMEGQIGLCGGQEIILSLTKYRLRSQEPDAHAVEDASCR